ncbi:unnamed protein product [Closterium sp. Yama58-4]|nr:unnamed protein product [Closterium sp. Yama58-4]
MRFGPGYSASVNPATNPPAPVVNWNGAPLAHDTHQGTIPPLTYVPATQSVQLGPEYSVSLNPATDPPSLAIVDYNGRPVAPTYNADGSATVAGYTAHRNGTITGPGGLAIYLGAGNALFSMGTTTVLKNGTIVDGSGKKLVPTKRPDGSYTAGDLTGWPSIGIIIGSGGAVINAGAPLTVTVDGSVAFALDVAPIPLPGVAISVNPATRSLRFGGYTLLLNGNKPSLLDCLSRPVRTTANPDGSLSLGNYTLYKNGTIAAPDGIAIDTVGPNTGLRVGTTTVLINGTVLDGSGAKITPTGPNEDGSYSAGDVKGWTNGTIISTKSVGCSDLMLFSLLFPLALAGSLASPPTALTALITLALSPLVFI